MTMCNKDAGDKKLAGDARKKFMSECLSAKKTSQQDKMKTCNKEAGDKKLAGAIARSLCRAACPLKYARKMLA